MKFHDIEQNSETWEQIRLGKITTSFFSDLLMKKETAGYKNLISRIAYERVTGERTEFYESQYMKRGHEIEPDAKEAYENLTFKEVLNGGFFELSDFVGGSPDGRVGKNGLTEFKCPAYNTMIEYLESQIVPKIYIPQLQGQLLVAGREWVDFMAFHPRLKRVIIRVFRDEELIMRLNDELEIAIEKINILIPKIQLSN